jgi:hypothetical protein
VGEGVLVGVGVTVGTTHVAEIVNWVLSGLVNVAARMDPIGRVILKLLAPPSENGAPVGPPGSTLYVPLMVVAALAADVNVNTALPFASGVQATVSAGVGGLVGVDVGVLVGVCVTVPVATMLLKPRTVLPACPVTVRVRHNG